MSNSSKKSIAIVSEAGPPVGDTVAEGGSLRAWGLAVSLSNEGYNVNFLYRKGYEDRVDSEAVKEFKDINVSTWNPVEKINVKIKESSVVIVRQSHAEASVIIDRLESKQVLVVDCYVPIHVEVSARDSSNKDQEYKNFIVDDNRWTKILARGDYFLYASENQKLYLMGVMAGILLLNPVTYRNIEHRFIKLPYCFFNNEANRIIESDSGSVSLLWYGGLYSWFDIGLLVPGLLKIKEKYPDFKFILAGAKNPYVKDKSLVESYNQAMSNLEPIKNFLVEIPHENYSKRFTTYSMASAIVYINKDGLENSLAWRTRLIDYILAKKPILTNAGDPLGNDLIDEGLALKVDLSNDLSLLEQFEKSLELDIERSYDTLLNKYSWEGNIANLAKMIKRPSRLIGEEWGREIKNNIKYGSVRRKSNLVIDSIRYLRSNGLKRTINRLKEYAFK